MKVKQLRFCTKCKKQHDCGIRDMETGEFTETDQCRDCLLGIPLYPITLDDMEKMINGLD